MLGLVGRDDMLAAKARDAATPVSLAVVQARVRELWHDAMRLEEANADGDSGQARLAIHREGFRVALSAWVPTADTALHAWRRAPTLIQNVFAQAGAGFHAIERVLGEAPTSETAVLLHTARELHQRALERFDADRVIVERYQKQWTVIWCAAALVLVVSFFGLASLIKAWRAPTDLAAGKPFTLSSSWATCHPDQGECGGHPMKILFHTNEQLNPWYQVDLGEPAPAFSSLTVRNRTDVAMMRCLPLVVEVSDDGKTFREVTRRTEVFVEWQPTFPVQRARYLRLRTDRQSTLHLEAVKVHP